MKLASLAPSECTYLFGDLVTGEFNHKELCLCLSAAYDAAAMFGETIQNCMLAGETIEDRLHLCSVTKIYLIQSVKTHLTPPPLSSIFRKNPFPFSYRLAQT